MRARQTQNVQQVVKINLQAPRRRKRVAKKKPTVRELKSGAPDTFRSENVAPQPIPFFGRQGPQVEPLRVQRVEEPRQLRLEDFGAGVVPPRPFREYITSLIEQPKTQLRVEEVKEDRVEAPPPPLIQTGPLAGLGGQAMPASSSSSVEKPRKIIFDLEGLTSSELFEARDRGDITREALDLLPVKRRNGFGGLVEVASNLGLVIPSKIKTGRKDALIEYILANM